MLTVALLGLAASAGCAPAASEGAAATTPIVVVTPSPVEREIRAYLGGYSFADNTPENSAAIDHPVVHTTAGGSGTYDDPITVGVGHVGAGDDTVLDWPAGTRFYVPNLRRYLVVEDTCGDGDRPEDGPCHTGYPADATTWLNVWVGGEGEAAQAPRPCMTAIQGVWTVFVNPSPDYAVEPGPIYEAGACTRQYGDTPITV
jgi:hypothetical protein